MSEAEAKGKAFRGVSFTDKGGVRGGEIAGRERRKGLHLNDQDRYVPYNACIQPASQRTYMTH